MRASVSEHPAIMRYACDCLTPNRKQQAMCPGQTLWRTGPDHCLSADLDAFRLVVKQADQVGGPVQFYVAHHDERGIRRIIASGIEPDVRTAMATAQATAERYAQ